MDVLLFAILFQVLAGTAALVASRSPRTVTVLGAGGALVGCVFGLPPALRVLLGGPPESLRLAWDAAHGPFLVEVDALGAFFLLPVLGLSALAAVYGADYLFAYRRHKSLGPPWFFFNLFVAGMVLVVLARTVLLFLMAWEIMSVAAYFLVTFEQEQAEVRRAGWIYLIAAHLGVAFLIPALVLLGRHAGSLEFTAFAAAPVPDAAWAGLIFLLALVGFGAKAGLVPFHVWLPEAHPAAPSHVSALMSGVMIKLGLYGLLRVLTYLGPPALWWGPVLGGLGLLTGLIGIALALHQRDVKRALAYSSIENVGLITLAVGVSLWGAASDLPVVAGLAMTAALLHVWNHAALKGLLFFGAGSVVHATGTKDMEKLGGLLRRMPWTGGCLIVGAVGVAALPPLNGFVSKWLLYLGLLKCGLASAGAVGLTALLSVGLLALIGGLTAIAFVRLTGIVLLGAPRSQAARHAHEGSPWLLGPMLVLVAFCLVMAVVPGAAAGLLGGPLDQLMCGGGLLTSEAPLAVVGAVNIGILLALAAGAALFLALTRRAGQTAGPTWGCGYVRPTPRMQYTGRSFSEMLAEHLLPRFLRPRTRRQVPHGLFPSKTEFGATDTDPVSAGVYEPFFRRCAGYFSRLRVLQQGKINVYVAYMVLMVVLTLAWVTLRRWWATL
jgi:formate hydrogenlyase subunit 3/multisubunit Na+/H+ antiporter MnhD subunit